MKNKKIALLENLGSDFYNARLRFALHLKSLNYDVTAIIPDDGFLEKIKSYGINVIAVSKNIRGPGLINKLTYSKDLYRIFRSNNFDIIHTYRFQPNIIGTLIAGIQTRSKIVNHVTGLGTIFTHSSARYRLMQLLTKFVYRFNVLLFKPILIFQNEQLLKTKQVSLPFW